MDWVRAGRAMALGALVLGSTGCGEEQVAPAPSTQYLFAPQFSGSWAGTTTLTSVTPVVRGECVSPSLETQIGLPTTGVERVNLALTQDATGVSGRLASGSTGLACTYKGTSSGNTMALDAATCDAPALILRCTNEFVREMELVGSTVQAQVEGGQMRGTVAYTYNVPGVTRVILQYDLAAGRP